MEYKPEIHTEYPKTKWGLERLKVGEYIIFQASDYHRISCARSRAQKAEKEKRYSIREQNNQYQMWRVK